MSAKNGYFIDRKTLHEIGAELFRLRKERGIYLKSAARQTGIPERIIEGMELGKFIQYTGFRRLAEFYGVKMKIVME